MLSDQELLRYSRQVLLAQIDIDGQLRLKHSKDTTALGFWKKAVHEHPEC